MTRFFPQGKYITVDEYEPEIEVLWKFIKYEWVQINAYESWTNLLHYLKKVLDNFGTEYVINFG